MDTLIGLPIWQWWIILGLVMLILELFISGFLVACFGIAAMITTIVAGCGASFTLQLIIFGVLNILCLYLLRPLLQKQFMGEEVKSCVDGLIGKELKLQEDFQPQKSYCEQKINGDIWRVRSLSGEALEAGRAVRVVERDGLTLIVKAIEE